MELYLIRRRHAFQPDEVEATVARADAQAEKVPDELRHIRSYLLDEGDGSLGATCVYEATGPRCDPRLRPSLGPARRRDHRGREHSDLAARSRPSWLT